MVVSHMDRRQKGALICSRVGDGQRCSFHAARKCFLLFCEQLHYSMQSNFSSYPLHLPALRCPLTSLSPNALLACSACHAFSFLLSCARTVFCIFPRTLFSQTLLLYFVCSIVCGEKRRQSLSRFDLFRKRGCDAWKVACTTSFSNLQLRHTPT